MEKTGDAVGRAEASVLGLDGAYASLMKKDFPAELKKTNEQQGELADMVDKSADSVHRLANEFSRTWEIISMGSQAAFGTLTDSLGLDKVAEKFNKTLSQELPAWIQTEKTFGISLTASATTLKTFFLKRTNFKTPSAISAISWMMSRRRRSCAKSTPNKNLCWTMRPRRA